MKKKFSLFYFVALVIVLLATLIVIMGNYMFDWGLWEFLSTDKAIVIYIVLGIFALLGIYVMATEKINKM